MSKSPDKDLAQLARLISQREKISGRDLELLFDVYLENVDEQSIAESRIPKEYELIYANKTRKEEIIANTSSAPLQLSRAFTSTRKFDDGWINKLIFGDNLKVLKSLLNDPQVKGRVKLVYIDPPFATKQDFKKGAEKAYSDRIIGAEFVEFIRKRLILIRELMAEDAVIYVHLDEKKSHYVKIVLDEVFGEDKFQREIIWDISVLSGFKTQAANWIRGHDTLLYYSKTKSFNFNKLMQNHTEEYLASFKKVDEDGRKYMVAHNKKRFLDDVVSKGKPFGDVWNDVPSFQQIPTSAERISYPTQKPEKLLDRIISASSQEGDLVLDAFAGSGTTIAVAEKLGRKWIGIDCGKLAIYTIQSRLLNLKEEVGNKGKPLKHKPFNLYSAGHYDYEAMDSMEFDAYRTFILELFQVRDKKHEIHGVELDGFKKRSSVLVWKHKDKKNVTITYEYLTSLHQSLKGQGGDVFYLIGPSSSFTFAEDRVLLDETEYRFYRVPQSIIENLINSSGKALIQPRGAEDVNNIIDAVAFDFIETPEVVRELKLGELEDADLLSTGKRFAQVKIKKFISKAATAENENLKALAMIMVDNNYDGEIFYLSSVFFADQITDNTIYLDFETCGSQVMIIYVDIYGNEFREIIEKKEFGKKK